MTTAAAAGGHWRRRPALAAVVSAVLLAVPLVASCAVVYALARALPPDGVRSWWGLTALLAAGLLVAAAVERAARRLLPIALLLKLSLVFPDRAPSRLRLARAAAGRRPRDELLWTGGTLKPTSTSSLVLALISALGTHDRRTRGHSERVRLLCDVLALELGLDEQDRDRLRWAALLHDVGKVDVAARILNKPAALDAAELEQVRLHPAAGAALAAPLLPWLGTWGDGILDHHERYDGTGYPHGKAGDEISEAGRLIGLIDAFETMTATRPYKKAMAHRAARAELARCAGTHFDPLYVRAFLAISLPRLLWAMGPLSFLLQLPYLASLAQSGARAGVLVPQGTGAAAAGVAGAAVLATGGAVTPPAPPPELAAAPRIPSSQPVERTGQDQVTRPAAPPAAPTRTTPAVRPAPPAPRSAPTVAAAPRRTTGRPAPTAPAAPATSAPRAGEDHPALASGPPATTTSRTATFELVPGTAWECQLIGAADGTPSRWEPCAGRFSVTVVRDGDQLLRVRDAQTRDQVDAWEWTVLAADAGPAPAAVPGDRGTSDRR